jgi:hypothetical protein
LVRKNFGEAQSGFCTGSTQEMQKGRGAGIGV